MKLRAAIAFTMVAVAFAWYVSKRPMDLRVYYYEVRGVFDGTRPVYGRESGLGWPMHYRYPPLFILLFTPFAWLPLGASAGLWVIAKLGVLVLLIKSMAKRMGTLGWVIPLLLAGPFVVQDFRYGNAQFFVFALTAFSLLLARERPLLSAAALALGIAVKVWPAFFLPFFVVRKDWKVAGWAVVMTLILAAIPSVYFGVGRNVSLLGEWFEQESATQTGQEEIWFPSQSLRGVMMRYFTIIDYSRVPDSNYRLVNIFSWKPSSIIALWLAAAAVFYAWFLWLTWSRRDSDGWAEAALGFCLVGLLQPFTQKYALVILLWPAIVAARFMKIPAARNLILIGMTLVVIQPLIPGAAAQRLLQVLGLDFAATVALAVALAIVVTSYSSFCYISFNSK